MNICHGESMKTKTTLTLEDAKKMAAAGEEEALDATSGKS
jgi:hypothetical protein